MLSKLRWMYDRFKVMDKAEVAHRLKERGVEKEWAKSPPTLELPSSGFEKRGLHRQAFLLSVDAPLEERLTRHAKQFSMGQVKLFDENFNPTMSDAWFVNAKGGRFPSPTSFGKETSDHNRGNLR